MMLDPAQLDLILDELRRGGTAMEGGSRCHTTWQSDGDGFTRVDFDEGYESTCTVSEPAVREAITRCPEAFVHLLQGPHLRAFRAAFDAGDRLGARGHLLAAAAIQDRLDQLAVFAAALGWPEHEPDPALRAIIRDKLAGFTAWHAFLDLVGWDKTPEKGRAGVVFVDRLLAIEPEPRGYRIRASFHEMAGDLAAAVADQRRVVDAAPEDAWWRKGDVERLAQLEARLSS